MGRRGVLGLVTGHFAYKTLHLQYCSPTLDILPTYFLECKVVTRYLRLKMQQNSSKNSFVTLVNFRLMPPNTEYVVH